MKLIEIKPPNFNVNLDIRYATKNNFTGKPIYSNTRCYLIEKAALLKETIYTFPDKIIGQSTEANIQSGVMYGGLFSVIGMINAIKLEMKNPNMKIIITGGFGKLISDKLSIEHVYSKSLTMDGMIQVYLKNSPNQTGK